MRVVAVVAAYNEERFIAGFIEQLRDQGVDVYLIDNDSTDRTVEIAHGYIGRGVIAVDRFPRDGTYRWVALLEHKSKVIATLEADWVMHADPDEVRLAPGSGPTLAEAFAEVEHAGYNAVNFQEFTFVPTVESPDHDHPNFVRTMRSYYPFLPRELHQVKAWKHRPGPVDLASSGGHRVGLTDLRVYPQAFPMRHYLYLSVDHAIRKYVTKRYDEAELARGWHGGRARLTADDIVLQSASDLRTYTSDRELDPTNPRTRHPLFARFERAA